MIYLVRHGESTANVDGRYSGITDVELSQRGRKQAFAAGVNLKRKKIENIFSSPLKRAIDTAKIISRENCFDENNIIVEKSLIEVNFGIFENMTWDEMRLSHMEETEKWIQLQHRYKFPNGEGYEDIIKRVSAFVDGIPDNSVVVTHFGVIQSMMLYLNIADDKSLWQYEISNCDILVLNNKKIETIIKCCPEGTV
ncbi:MAG: histidine phosphatase family protein [Sedimentibacter sp.]|uniref:histidine phosphatase family protein n=1 Tax=Sedimentibacter sp. TaxID=1960295 RepID=UPI0031583788